VKLKVPMVVGVPLMTPVEARDSPAGRLPEVIVHVKGGTPPEACKVVAAYAWFGTPPGRVVVVTARGNGAPMAIVNTCVAEVPFESVTMMVKLELTCAVGVPEIVTERVVLLPSESPAVSEPDAMDHIKGGVPPVAFAVAVYALPKFPAGRLVDVTFSGPGVLLHPFIPMHATSRAKNRNKNPAHFTMATP
jgi:hypothetical protein